MESLKERLLDSQPDRYCVTLANGECVGTDPRDMHLMSTEEQLLQATVLAMDMALDRPPDTRQCDCCEKWVPADDINTGYVYGLETAACRACRGDGDG